MECVWKKNYIEMIELKSLYGRRKIRNCFLWLRNALISDIDILNFVKKLKKKKTIWCIYLNRVILQNCIRFFDSNGSERFNSVFSILLQFWSISSFERLIRPNPTSILGTTN